jgi:hypothetical protein
MKHLIAIRNEWRGLSRLDHIKLRAFELADGVAALVYPAVIAGFMREELSGLTSQMRR